MAGWLANNRAVFYEKQGRYQDALEAGEQAVKAKVLALGENHFDVAISYSNVAGTLMKLGRINEAVEISQRAISIFTATLGPQHPSTASALDVLAELMCARRDFAKAIQLSETAMGIWEREWGADHMALAYPLTTLGEAFLGLEQAKKAIPPLERALKIRELSDPEPELLAKTRFALARALFRTGSPLRGRHFGEQALKDLRGDSHARTQAADIERWLTSPDAPSDRLSMR
jgi:tetratricopeptide (TPR) repeat protein